MTIVPELRDGLVAAASGPLPRRPTTALPIVLAVGAIAIVAVTLTIAASRPQADREPAGAPTPVAASTPEGPQERSFGCEAGFSMQASRLQDGWREAAITVGPITFLELGDMARLPDWNFAQARERAPHEEPEWAEQLLENGPDKWAAVYIKVLVEPGRSVRVELPQEAGTGVSLWEAPRMFGGFVPSDGVRRVRFAGCDARPDAAGGGGETAYPLGIIVAGAQCVPFDVTPEGGETIRRRIAFGRGAPC